MYKNKSADNRNNLCGLNIARIRKENKLSQRALADKLQIIGLDVDKNAVQRIECGKRFITDIELLALARAFGLSVDALYDSAGRP